MILLAAATELEIPNFINNEKEGIEVLITGVGVPASIYHLQKKIATNNYSLVIQAGIAGAFTSEFNLGEVVLVQQDCFADIGAEENEDFKTIFDMGFGNKNDFPYSNGWLVNTHPYLKQSNLELTKAITINKVSDSVQQKKQMMEAYNPEIETMEGAALHYVCLMEKIPFLQIRSISNYVGDRNKANWKMAEAIENLNIEITTLIEEFL